LSPKLDKGPFCVADWAKLPEHGFTVHPDTVALIVAAGKISPQPGTATLWNTASASKKISVGFKRPDPPQAIKTGTELRKKLHEVGNVRYVHCYEGIGHACSRFSFPLSRRDEAPLSVAEAVSKRWTTVDRFVPMPLIYQSGEEIKLRR
jgi:hypothetical protein